MVKALIAEDERLLADELRESLAVLWPELAVCAVVHDGAAALAAFESERPDVLFLDIEMPGLSGIDVARLVAPQAQVVFVTAFDRFAVRAFEDGAVDYLLKPLDPARLALALQRVKARLGRPPDLARPLDALRDARAAAVPLRWVTTLSGRELRFIPIEDVLCFDADRKYVCVVTASGESLITTPLKELLQGLDPQRFWRIHRGTIVNVEAIDSVRRNDSGKLEVRLRSSPRVLAVSDRHAHLFRQM